MDLLPAHGALELIIAAYQLVVAYLAYVLLVTAERANPAKLRWCPKLRLRKAVQVAHMLALQAVGRVFSVPRCG